MSEPDFFRSLSSEVTGYAIPPVESWNPPFKGDIDIRIAADGQWFHDGEPIRRPALVRLFASILWREGDEYFLVTPAEKVRIRVDDAPLRVINLEWVDTPVPGVMFETDTGDRFMLDADHPLTMRNTSTGEPRPYVRVRRNLEALVHRNVFYELVTRAREVELDGAMELVIDSAGAMFPLGVWQPE